MTGRKLEREEISQVWNIDRAEVIHRAYHLAGGELVLEPDHRELKGWPANEPEIYTPLLLECYDRGGWFEAHCGGIGKALFSAAAGEAARRGAKKLYISASPSEQTVNVYVGLGCIPTSSPDPDLLRLGPNDIHLEYASASG